MTINVLKGAVLTEKGLQDAEKGNYTFEVALTANKKQIARAVKEAFDVEVSSVKTTTGKGKKVRVLGTSRKRKAGKVKKAVIQTIGNKKIALFEGK